MKKLLLIALLTIGFNSYAQETATETDPKTTWSCTSASFNKENNVLILNGTVNFKTDTIKISDASELIYNLKTKEITVKGVQTFEIKGSVKVADPTETDTLTYKLGDEIAYLN